METSGKDRIRIGNVTFLRPEYAGTRILQEIHQEELLEVERKMQLQRSIIRRLTILLYILPIVTAIILAIGVIIILKLS